VGGALVIVFREVLEAGLIIGIVLAATQKVAGSRLWVAGGVAAGLFGSCLVALFMSAIAEAFNGYGQELFNACVLGTAVLMLAWHNIWMAQHGRTMAAKLHAAGREVAERRKPMLGLAVVVGAAVLREGAEVVLFLYGVALGGSSAASLLVGGVLGLLLGGAVTGLTYLGLLRIPTRYLFSVTSWLITLLAAGLSAQAAGYLAKAGVIEALGQTMWDSSWLLSQHSLPGMLLHTLIGYSDRPTALQLIVYVGTLLAIVAASRYAAAPPPRPVSAE